MRARTGRKPRALIRGPKLLDGITGEEIFRNDSSTRYQRGMYMHKTNFDVITDEQREEMLRMRIR